MNMTRPKSISTWALIPFLGISFGLTWGILALFIFLPEATTRLFGELTGRHPLFYLAVYSPALAAVTLVVAHSGLPGLRGVLSRLTLWRSTPGWYLLLFVVTPLPFFAGAAIKGSLWEQPCPFDSLWALGSSLFFMAIKGPVEEFGWRGLALPLLQRKMTPFGAALVLGIIWGAWHYPAFLLSGTPQSAWSFTPFFVGTIALSVMVTPMFNASRGSLLLSAVFHFQLINPVWPDGQPYDTAFFVLLAALVVWFQRKSMFTRKDHVTSVIPMSVEVGV